MNKFEKPNYTDRSKETRKSTTLQTPHSTGTGKTAPASSGKGEHQGAWHRPDQMGKDKR